jgi:hypothetical protein
MDWEEEDCRLVNQSSPEVEEEKTNWRDIRTQSAAFAAAKA